MTISYQLEYQIDQTTQKGIAELLQNTFTEVEFLGRTYFKQIPHSRFLAKEDGKVIGHLGVDYRAMNMNGEAIKVFGVYDLCVAATYQGKGISKQLMHAFENLAIQHKHNVDFLFLATDIPDYYEKLAFQKIKSTISWLKIHKHNNYGVGKELIDDTFFMVKPISGKQWQNGDLDLLGYMY